MKYLQRICFAAIASALSGCETVGKTYDTVSGLWDESVILPCPNYRILSDASRIVIFRNGQGRDLIDINIIDRGSSGRVTKLEIKLRNSKKPIVLIKDDIRRIFSFLPSNLFIINKLNDNLWLFKGGGFGHGVGLSQSGAIEMAELGFTYEQILNHYYQGTKIKKIEISSQ